MELGVTTARPLVPTYDICRDSHRVTIRLPQALSLENQEKLVKFLKYHYQIYTSVICWENDFTIRLVARVGQEQRNNLDILEQYARRACERIINIWQA